MNKTHFLFLFSALLMMSACGGGGSDDPVVTPPTPGPNTPITPSDTTKNGGGDTPDVQTRGIVSFLPSLTAMTRATDTQFEAGDRIGVFAVKASADDNRAILANKGGNYADNVVYSYSGGKFTATNGIEIPGDAKLFYTAVYPYTSTAANVFTFDVNENQSTAAAYTASDLCTASTEATDAKEVELKFSHRLSKIIINLTGDGWTGNNISVKMRNVIATASIDLNSVTFVGAGSKKDIVCAPNGTRSYKVIVPPQVVGRGEKIVTVTMNGVEYSLDTQSELEWRSGKSYEYTLGLEKPNDTELVFFTGDINPWNVDERINDVVPEDIQGKMGPYIPIYRGNKPPHIEGTVFVNPFAAVYCEDQGNGGYAPGTVVNSSYIRFSNQNTTYNTIDIDQTNEDGTSTSTGAGAFISGTGDNFTAFFNTVGQTDGISTKTALVISGTKTSGGIQNLKYAFVMVDKGNDPNSRLMAKGVFRVFEDQDAMSEYVSWPGSMSRSAKKSDVSRLLTPFSLK